MSSPRRRLEPSPRHKTIDSLLIDPNSKSTIFGSPRHQHNGFSQAKDTVFKVDPEEWRNVPKIVYDAIAALIQNFDMTSKKSDQKMTTFTSQILDCKSAVRQADI